MVLIVGRNRVVRVRRYRENRARASSSGPNPGMTLHVKLLPRDRNSTEANIRALHEARIHFCKTGKCTGGGFHIKSWLVIPRDTPEAFMFALDQETEPSDPTWRAVGKRIRSYFGVVKQLF